MPLTPGSRLGAYEILAPIGAGGMGEVYRATDTRLKREVAIKVLPEAFASDPDRLARFQREAELLGTLNHRSIATVYGIEETGGIRAIVMELVAGETLAEKIERGSGLMAQGSGLKTQGSGAKAEGSGLKAQGSNRPKPLAISPESSGIPIDEALSIARQIAEALEAAHEKGVVHRDLKPANVKMTPEGTVKVLDFGLAKLTEIDPSSPASMSPTLSLHATQAGVILGTAAYMSPEQARGRPVDRRTDIWAFGCVLFEMLTGRQTFEAGDAVSDAIASILKTDPDWNALPPDTPVHIRTLLRRCLQKDPQKRLPHIGLARFEIEEGGTDLRPSPMEEPAPRIVAAPGRRHGWLPWSIAALLLVTSAALGSVILLHREPADLGAVRFSVSPPDGWTFGNNLAQRGTAAPAPHLALSPDGRRLAYIMYGTGKAQLWVKQLDAASGQPVAGTDDASFPFWSPDGRFIAFFASGKLRKIDTSGGPGQTLCDAPAGEGGTWNAAGDIVFAPDSTGPLVRVSAAGGAVTPVTTLGTSETSHRWPQFLPDGRSFLYLAVAAGQPALYVGTLVSKDRTLVMKGVERTQYASGHLLFVREGTLMAQPFDAASRRLVGDGSAITEDVAFNTANHRTGFSANDSGFLAYRTGGGINAALQITRFDRMGQRVESLGMPAAYSRTRLSPDDSLLAVRINDAVGQGDWWLMDVARAGVSTRLTSLLGSTAGSAFWSPDGKQLVFAFADQSSSGISDWYRRQIAGGAAPELLLKTPYAKPFGDWSADGRFIIYAETRPQTRTDLWVLPRAANATPQPFLQTNFVETEPRFSPDGRWVAYVSDEGGMNDVYLRSFPMGDRKIRVSSNGGGSPVWRRDGQELFYVDVRKVMSVDIRPGANLEVGKPHELFETRMLAGGAGYFNATSDGQQFLIAEPVTSITAPPITMIVNWPALLKK